MTQKSAESGAIRNTKAELEAGEKSRSAEDCSGMEVSTDCDNHNSSLKRKMVKITGEDIEDEIEFWKTAMVCYVLGANPPLYVMEGFCKRMWSEKVDKIGSPSYGVFLV